jgi:hypothetical protein
MKYKEASMFSQGMFYIVVFLLAQVVLAQELVMFKATKTGLEVPEGLPQGFHEIALETGGMKGYTLSVFRLNEGVDLETVKAAYTAINEAYMTGGDPTAAMRAMTSLGDIVLDIDREPDGVQKIYGLVFEAGNYAVYSASYSEESYGEYVYELLEIAPLQTPAPSPQVDQKIQLVDFAFTLPADLHSGEQTWEVVNFGKQIHHLVLVKLKEGVTIEEGETYAQTQAGEDPADYANSHFLGALAPGHSVYMNVSLVPGNYIVVCHIPDYSEGGDGEPHLAHGMMQSFTISE